MRIKSAVVITLISLVLACGGVQQAIASRFGAPVCRMPGRPRYAPARGRRGRTGRRTVHDAGLRAELASGETTLAEIKAAFEMFCNAN